MAVRNIESPAHCQAYVSPTGGSHALVHVEENMEHHTTNILSLMEEVHHDSTRVHIGLYSA